MEAGLLCHAWPQAVVLIYTLVRLLVSVWSAPGHQQQTTHVKRGKALQAQGCRGDGAIAERAESSEDLNQHGRYGQGLALFLVRFGQRCGFSCKVTAVSDGRRAYAPLGHSRNAFKEPVVSSRLSRLLSHAATHTPPAPLKPAPRQRRQDRAEARCRRSQTRRKTF